MVNRINLSKLPGLSLLVFLIFSSCEDQLVETVVIRNQVSIFSTDSSASEATPSDTAKITVFLTDYAPDDLTVDISINADTVTGPENGDFTVSGGSLGSGSTSMSVTIPQGEDFRVVTITAVTGDGDVDNETCVFTLESVSADPDFQISTMDNTSITIIDNGLSP